MASSEHFPNLYAATSAPPPTPSSQPNNHHHLTSPAAVDALSRLLHRLPPSLSLPTRRSSLSTSLIPAFYGLNSAVTDHLLSASSQLGFFQLTHHNITSDLADSAESEARALFQLSREQKESYFPRDWPFGFEEDEDGNGETFWLDASVSCESTELSLASLSELSRALGKMGLEIVEMLSGAVGFENPFRDGRTRVCPVMVVHGGSYGDKPVISGGCYPYVVGLQYVVRSWKYSLLADSGWVSVQPQPDSVMVTVGDIAQVWSNGKLKKVRGRPLASNMESDSKCISITLLLSLPTEATVSPLLSKLDFSSDPIEKEEDEEDNNIGKDEQKEKRMFKSFLFEDYAWRVYHEPPIFKDPLDKFRIHSSLE